MPIILYRVDDRLIHGQILAAWVPELKINHIIIISNKILNDETRKNIMRFSTPEGIKLDFSSTENALNFLSSIEKNKDNALVLFSNLEDVLEVLKSGLKINSLNIGGIHYSTGKNFSLGKAIFLSESDCDNLKSINNLGVKIEGRGVPKDKELDILESIK